MQPLRDFFNYLAGYNSSQSPVGEGALPNTIIKGSKNVTYVATGVLEAFKGFYVESLASGGLMFDIYGDNFAYIDGLAPFATGGNIFMGTGKSLWGVGAGSAKYYDKNSSTLYSLGSITAAGGALQVWTLSGGVYSQHTAGLSVPSTGSLIANDITGGFTGKIEGTVAAEFTKYRSTTGAESRPSLPTAIVSFNKQYARIYFPPATDLTDGADYFRLYLSLQGFGSSGPFRYLDQYQMTVGYTPASGFGTVAYDAGAGRYYIEIEWYDSNLLETEPATDLFIPPVGTHTAQFGNVNIVLGTYGGLGVSSSIPNYPEAFPPSRTSFLSEQPVGVLGNPQDGYIWVICKNSMWALLWTGAPDGPAVMPRAIWSDTGCENASAACVVRGNLYAFTGRKGIVRTNGTQEPDTTFAYPVLEDVKAWDAKKVVVGYSPQDNVVVFAHDRQMLLYHVDLNLWSAPIYLDDFLTAVAGTIASVYTANGLLHVSVYNAGTYSLYTFNYWVSGGAGNPTGTNWEVIPQWSFGGSFHKTVDRFINTASMNGGTLRTRAYKDLDLTTAIVDVTSGTSTGDKHFTPIRKSLRKAKSYTVKLSGSGMNQRVYGTETHGRTHRMVI
jgi:hypothetical protein